MKLGWIFKGVAIGMLLGGLAMLAMDPERVLLGLAGVALALAALAWLVAQTLWEIWARRRRRRQQRG